MGKLYFTLAVKSTRLFNRKMEDFYYETSNFINSKIEENISRKAERDIFDIIEMGLGEETFYKDKLEFAFPDHCSVAAEVSIYWYRLITSKYFTELEEYAKKFTYTILSPKENVLDIIKNQPNNCLIFEFNDALYYYTKEYYEIVGCDAEDWNRFTESEKVKIEEILKKNCCTDELSIKFRNS